MTENKKPDAYALRYAKEPKYWIGIWEDRDIAERLKTKVSGETEILEVYTYPRSESQ